jgi:hypothetical protein
MPLAVGGEAAMLLPVLLACASDIALDARILLHTHDKVGSLCAALSAWLNGLRSLPALLLLLLLRCVATAAAVGVMLSVTLLGCCGVAGAVQVLSALVLLLPLALLLLLLALRTAI